MKKVVLTILAILTLLLFVTAGVGYGYLTYHYRDVFMPGMTVNSVYAAEMTVDEVNRKLKKNMEIPVVTVTDKNGNTESFSMAEADYDENYTDELKRLREDQDILELVARVFGMDIPVATRELEPVITYDEEKLVDFLDGWDMIADNTDLSGKKIEIEYRISKGYYLVDDTLDMLNHDKARDLILDSVRDGEYEVELSEKECYEKPERYTSAQEYALDTWKKLKAYMDTEIVFDFTDRKVTIAAPQISNWLALEEDGTFKLNEDGNLWLDEEAIEKYVKELCDLYSTVNKPRTFKAHNGKMVTIDKGTYGSKIDYKPEFEFVMANLNSGRHVERKPEYSQVPFSGLTGIDDIGGIYIEVDMSEQHLYYYVNGVLKLDSDVVTGNTSLGRGTPERVCYVYFKQRNRVLRGEDYATPVNYWMAVYNNIGIHDANWRGKFGGSIYRTNGSHGCVNTPIAKVKELYSMVEVGTPVLLHY